MTNTKYMNTICKYKTKALMTNTKYMQSMQI